MLIKLQLTRIRKFIRTHVHGIISGGADNDPAGISTYAISGARFGYQQLWLLVLSTPMLIAVQAMCARLGDVKRKGLMVIFREHYHPVIAISAMIILLITNIATLSADLLGVADSFELISGISRYIWIIPIAFGIWYVEVFKSFKVIEKYLFLLTFVFLGYIITAFLSKPDWVSVLRFTILPDISVSPGYFVAALGLLGTTITPFLFFWQSRQDLEEHLPAKELENDIRHEDTVLAPGFIWSNIISFFIIVSTSAVLHANGRFDIKSAAEAARVLEPFAGSYAKILFALGIIGSGILAIPVLAASTAYAVAETFHWHESLSDKPSKAKGFYAVVSLSIVAGLLIILSGVDPIQSLFYSQVLNGILAPVLIILILLLASDRKIMGKFVNRGFDTIFGWLTVFVMIFGTCGLVWQILVK